MIQGHGNGTPKVMLVGDFPTPSDLTTNYALSGYAGNLLDQLSRTAGLSFRDFYKTTLIKDRVPDLVNFGKKGKKKQTESDISKLHMEHLVPKYKDFLLNEINDLRPNLIVPLGETSFQFLSGLTGIRKFRGSILRLDPRLGIEKYTKILPTLGPYPYLNQDWKQKFITQIDFNKISKWSGEQLIPDDTFKIWTAKTSLALSTFLNRTYNECAARSVRDGGYLVFDIESYMNIPTCISFCFDGFESVCIPFLDKSIEITQRFLMMKMVAKVLASPIPKVNQNIKFDWKTQERWGFKVNNVVGDTMLGTSILYCEFPKNLGFLTSIYTDLPYFKDEGKAEYDPSKYDKECFYMYNAKDSLAVHQIYVQQQAEFIENGVEDLYHKVIRLIPIYRQSEDRGLLVDEQQRAKLLYKYESLFRVHCKILRTLVNNDEINPLSSKQMNTLVFETLGYKIIRRVKGTDETSLNILMCFGSPSQCTIQQGKEILREILWCRKIHKVIEMVELDIYPDGRFRHESNLSGTETGRSSGGVTTDYFLKPDLKSKKTQKTKKGNLGHSFQTIGKHGFWLGKEKYGTDIRSMYVATPGYSFVEIDGSGAESRVDRILSGQFDLSVFDNPGIHKLTGSWLFNCTPNEVKKNTHEYHLSKTARHAAERNITADGFFAMVQDEGVGLSLTLKQSDVMLKEIHNKEPFIREVFHYEIKRSMEATNCLIAPNGRRRDFFDRIDHGTINEGISQLPQAIVTDQTKIEAILPTFEKFPWARLIVEAHDGAMAEIPNDRIEEYAKEYVKNFEKPIDFRKGSIKRDYQLVIPAEVSVSSTNWQELEGIKL